MREIVLLIFVVGLTGCTSTTKPAEAPMASVPQRPLSQQERCAIFADGAADKWATSEIRMIAYHAGVKFGCW
jgi:hypothetical protein